MNTISPRHLGALAGAGSAFLLLAALAFQAAGYAPCELCILQRWPHVAAALLGLTRLPKATCDSDDEDAVRPFSNAQQRRCGCCSPRPVRRLNCQDHR